MSDPTTEWKLEDLDYWRLCDELSIVEAALLVIGESPGQLPYVEEWEPDKLPKGYLATRTAITNALRLGKIKGKIFQEAKESFDGKILPFSDSIARNSRVEVASLKEWLAERGFKRGFFFPNRKDEPDYLDRNNPRFAPKLAAAVRAWQAVGNPAGKSPKQALLKWLREHAAEFELSDENGAPNETGIEEIAKVANWQLGGGAPKTPGGSDPPPI